MNSYINLLNEEEIHFLSAARDDRVLRTSAAIGCGILVFALCAVLLSYRARVSKASRLKNRWANIESKYNEAVTRKKKLKESKQLVEELKGWEKARPQCSQILEDLQNLVPETMQFTSLKLSSYIAGIENVPRSFLHSNAPLEAPERRYSLTIQGSVVDVNAEGARTVSAFRESAKQAPELADLLKNVTIRKSLAGKEIVTPDGKRFPGWDFIIEFNFNPRLIRWNGQS